MEVFVLVLNRIDCLNEILRDMLNEGFRDATVTDCRGMLRELDAGTDDDAPMLSMLRHFHAPERSRCKLVITVIDSADRPKLVDIINRRTGGLDRVDTGVTFSIPLAEVRGIAKA